MTFEITLALTLLVFLAALAAIAFFTLSRVVSLFVAHAEVRDEPSPVPLGYEDDRGSTLATVVEDWGYRPVDEGVEDEDSGHTLLPFSTPLPPFPHFQMVEYSEDEDDVPTTLYRTDDDGELALLAEFDD